MSKKQGRPKTPDESIPQDPGIPGPGTKEGEWPPESGTAGSSEETLVDHDSQAGDASVSEAVGRMPRHRADEKHESER